MKIAIIGYGKMGHVIAEIAISRGHTVIAKITSVNAHLTEDCIKTADVALCFSIPEAAESNVISCFNAGVPVVIGTTGWLKNRPYIEQQCTVLNGGMFYASNFSIGMNIFYKMNSLLAKWMNSHHYEVSIEEIHHTQKLDAPSGTALILAQQIIDNTDKKKTWVLGNIASDTEIPIDSKRIGNTPGTHTVYYENRIDKIEITHQAKGREGFALGAVLAAEFMDDKVGLFGMDDLLQG